MWLTAPEIALVVEALEDAVFYRETRGRVIDRAVRGVRTRRGEGGRGDGSGAGAADIEKARAYAALALRLRALR